MNEEHFQRLLRQLEEMSDDEFVRSFERAGMVVERLPEGIEVDEVVIEMETPSGQPHMVIERPRRVWSMPGMEAVGSHIPSAFRSLSGREPVRLIYSQTIQLSTPSYYVWESRSGTSGAIAAESAESVAQAA